MRVFGVRVNSVALFVSICDLFIWLCLCTLADCFLVVKIVIF